MAVTPFQHKYPYNDYQGRLVSGHGEVDENDVLHIIIYFNAYLPQSSKLLFGGSIDALQAFVNDEMFSTSTLEHYLKPYLMMAKLAGYEYRGVMWKRDKGVGQLDRWEQVIERVGLRLMFDLPRMQDVASDFVDYSVHNQFITTMLSNTNAMLDSLQTSYQQRLMFVPYDFSKIRSERKVRTMNTVAAAPHVLINTLQRTGR